MVLIPLSWVTVLRGKPQLESRVCDPRCTLPCSLIHFIGILELGHLCEQGGPVQRPAISPARGLYQCCEVGLWDVQP